jgi:hypothetical protein
VDVMPHSDVFGPLASIWMLLKPDGERRAKPAEQKWGWARCTNCGCVQAKPVSSRGGVTRVLATHRHCVFCGSDKG